MASSEARQALLKLSGLEVSEQRLRAACPLPAPLRACLRLAAASKKELLALKKLKKGLRDELMVRGTTACELFNCLGSSTATLQPFFLLQVTRPLLHVTQPCLQCPTITTC
jgi:hypothetical protein